MSDIKEGLTFSGWVIVIGMTAAAIVLVTTTVLALLQPEEPAYVPDECKPTDGYCGTWSDYHEGQS